MQGLRRFFRPSATALPPERRQARRVRTRLRPGKVLDAGHGFVADCAIIERSIDGLRIRSFGDGRAVGEAVVVFDEKEASLRPGRVVWARGREAGIRFSDGPAAEADAEALRRIAGPYYAVGD